MNNPNSPAGKYGSDFPIPTSWLLRVLAVSFIGALILGTVGFL